MFDFYVFRDPTYSDERGLRVIIGLMVFVVMLGIVAVLLAAWYFSGRTPPSPLPGLFLRLAVVLGLVEVVLLGLRWVADRYL